ncbi:MAG: acyl carrier protein [Alphaproteobacteria bacterium]|nr:acyl carrier protein [Alphaproteobacteria bacterium]
MATTAALQDVFVRALDLPADTDFGALAYRSVPQWDSIAHMRLVAELESTFDLMLDADEVIDLSSFTVCQQILARHGVTWDG